jgi:penicillin-binding protein 1A
MADSKTATRAQSGVPTALHQLARAIATDAVRLAAHLSLATRVFPTVAKLTIATCVVILCAAAAAVLWALARVPADDIAAVAPSVLVESANGQPLGRVGPLADAVRRQDLPETLVKAVLSIEDRRFYYHYGVDPLGVTRALWANWNAGEIVEGGSTITQQLAKMRFVGAERSFDRKLREALTAIWLDFRLGKDEVLTQYLNGVYLGAGAHGVSAASRVYFDKDLSQLTLAESAMLAGLIQAPSRYDPIRNGDAARRRANVVLDAMLETGAIDATAAERAKAEPAKLTPSPRASPSASWFSDWIAKHELPKIAGSTKRAMRVRTTFQPEIQQIAAQAVEDVLTREGAGRGVSQAALVAMRPDGSVVAMVGGRNYNESQFNRAADAQRQPGSTFKLFVYYAALRNGYSPGDTIDASPIEIGRWHPENYGGQQYGRMTLSQAFAHSINSAAVRLAMTVGLDKVVDAARDLGLRAPLARVPSMALGSNEVSLLDLTGAFASVRLGRRIEPWGIQAFGAEGTGLRSLGAPSASGQELPYRRGQDWHQPRLPRRMVCGFH